MFDFKFSFLASVVLRACYSLLNMPYAPDISVTVMRKVSSSLYHFLFDTIAARFGMAARSPTSFSLRILGSMRIYWDVSIAQPRTVFFVIHCASPFASLFNKKHSYLYMLSSFWGHNKESMKKTGVVSYV